MLSGHQPHLTSDKIKRAEIILGSYLHWIGRELLAPLDSPETTAAALFEAPLIVLSHGTETDPIFNYANRLALESFEYTWDEFMKLPSRLSAEPMHQAERAAFMEKVSKHGYAEGYSGVRISKSGKRFHIEDATVWNVIDAQGRPAGHAAAISRWTLL